MALGAKLNGMLRTFIERQKMFFVATAAADGRVNVPPKGADTLRVIDNTQIRWLNLSGSGNETAGHLAKSNRLTLMSCAFKGDALILRVYSRAETIHPRDPKWEASVAMFPRLAGSRQIFNMTIDSVQTSCGTGVTVMEFAEDRAARELVPYYEDLGPKGVEDYWWKKNVLTIDGFETELFED